MRRSSSSSPSTPRRGRLRSQPPVGDDGAIRGPAGDGRISPAAYEDIADAATCTAIGAGEPPGVSGDVELLTGRPARTLTAVLTSRA